MESGGCVPICKTEVINDNLNPMWKPVMLTTQQYGSKARAPLCLAIDILILDCISCNYVEYSLTNLYMILFLQDTPLIIECFDFDGSGEHKPLGYIIS